MAKNLLTFNGLTNKLDEELGWRRKELFLIKSKIPKDENSLQAVLLRSAIPFLYAHWEGYIKVVLSSYLQYVSNKHLKHNELKYSFVALSLQNKIGQLDINNIINKTIVVEALFKEYTKKSNIPKKNIINTKSNLNFGVFQEILIILNLEDTYYNGKESLINDLVDMRNHIAHGEYLKIDLTAYIAFHDEIVALLEYIKTQIENCALGEKYRL